MSNQYYKFLVEQLLNWLSENEGTFAAGSRFFEMFDEETDVQAFNQYLVEGDFPGKEVFDAQNDGLDFKTIAFNIPNSDKKVLFVAALENVKHDFLVTLRNRVSENNGIWQNTNIVFIVYQDLDSIISGSFDLSQGGAPFDLNLIKENLSNRITRTELSKADKAVVNHYLAELLKDESTALKDYETIFSVLSQATISTHDYNKMGLFSDKNLDTMSGKALTERIAENHKFFQAIEQDHDFGDVEERISNRVAGPGIIKDLKDETWAQTDFTKIEKGIEELNKDKDVKLNLDFHELDNLYQSWVRPDGESQAAKRKLNVLISSYDFNQPTFTFEIPFDDKVFKSSIAESTIMSLNLNQQKDVRTEIDTKNKKLIVTIHNFESNTTYGGQFTYRHRKINRLTFRISFMIVPFKLDNLDRLKPGFSIKTVNKKNNRFVGFSISDNITEYIFGNGATILEAESLGALENQEIANKQIVFSDNASFEDQDSDIAKFTAKYNGQVLPVVFENRAVKAAPSSAMQIEKLRLAAFDDGYQLQFLDNKIVQGSNAHAVEIKYRENFLELEQQMIAEDKGILFGRIINNEVFDDNDGVPSSVVNAYHKLFAYYRSEETLPSLAIMDVEHKQLLQNILDEINSYLTDTLVQNQALENGVRQITQIGQFKKQGNILLTPFNPLLIAYQLELDRALDGKVPHLNVLKTLNPQNLIPYLKINNEDFIAQYDVTAPRWLFYNQVEKAQLSNTASNIIHNRISDYIKQYGTIFATNRDMPLNIAAVNIVDESNFFDAIVAYFMERLSDDKVTSIEQLNPLNLYLDKIGFKLNSLFAKLFKLNVLEGLDELLPQPLKIAKKIKDKFEDYQILDLLQTKINIYHLPAGLEDIPETLSFDITFNQFTQEKQIDFKNIDLLDKNYSLGGLISGPQFKESDDFFINGFGVSDLGNAETPLIKFTSLWNSLMLAAQSATQQYESGKTFVNYLRNLPKSEIAPILKLSNWVTFIKPDVSLSYFYNDHNGEMLVIHYMDQSATNQYEAVTVTNKVVTYEHVLQENILKERTDGEISPHDTQNVIKNFNLLNGNWLLRLVANVSNHVNTENVLREKLSLITAYKQAYGILDIPGIFWIPISLEEVLRVSTMVGMSKDDGLFSAKNLGGSNKTGPISDDLLFVGIDTRSSALKMHFVPVEVKIGLNSNQVTDKAEQQLAHTNKILKAFLTDANDDLFMRRYYVNFFKALVLGNFEKLLASDLYYTSSEFDFIKLKNQLMADEFTVSFEMDQWLGNGIIFEFTNGVYNRKLTYKQQGNYTLINVPEDDAYNIVTDDIEPLVTKIQAGEFGFPTNELLREKILQNPIANLAVDSDLQQGELADIASSALTITMADSTTEIHKDITYDENSSEEAPVVPEVAETVNAYELPEIEPVTTNISESTQASNVEQVEAIDNQNDTLEMTSGIIKPEDDNLNDSVEQDNISVITSTPLEAKRMLIGQSAGSTHRTYWEYGNPGLANRHMLVTGQSGQGKTYFIQTMLAEFVKNQLDTIVVDYTDGFLSEQLDPEFLELIDDKLNIKLVYFEGLPINPFKLQMKSLEGYEFEENVNDMADRVVQVLDYVFNLGIQQRALLKSLILEGCKINNNKMTFTKLKIILEDSEIPEAKKLRGRLEPLIERDPFNYTDEFNWSQLLTNHGIVHIFQLSLLQPTIQKAMIEFLLWDLYQYSQGGSKDKPIPIVLDEVQNLDFSSTSPFVKILREGRKFGWSGIFATQDIDSVNGDAKDALFNVGTQVHFKPTESQVANVAKLMATDSNTRANLMQELSLLRRGWAVVNGPQLNSSGQLTPSYADVVQILGFDQR
ncbi:ATP-binding protein [Periweissella ghanensis]|uniref:Helicase HerA central domain-containing protein n=1 Tax=Periweissella ghanensis TaxID=467997 RepID=A0ABN8BJU2_9LACO|nr:DUF87 domain-containing protein [Periweissella ghanensis]MCM0601144.1 DUF87 domain-containing protein [Periweissella ghanensis]CAH0417940.1 hypothetical protein WGH24286_00356 [Periweissella ghanensis]